MGAPEHCPVPFGELAWPHARKVLARRGPTMHRAEIAGAVEAC